MVALYAIECKSLHLRGIVSGTTEEFILLLGDHEFES